MESNNSKWIAAGLALSAIMLMFSVTQTLKTDSNVGFLDEVLKVSMPRPIKEMLLGFSLEGRNIIREIDAGVFTKPLLKKIDVKPTGISTKALVDKGAKSKANTTAAATAERAKLYEQRRKAFEARVIEQADRYRQSLRAQAPSGTYEDYEADINVKKKSATPNVTDTKTEEADKRTSGEWKSLVLSQPTVAHIQEMIKALPTGDIEIDTYLEITETLIKDNSQDKRQKGLLALNAVYRQEAFVMASHLAVDTDTATQKLLSDYMYNYNRTQTLSVLDSVLKSADAVAAASAAQSITKAIQNIQANTTANQSTRTGGSRSRTGSTGGTVQQLTINSYQRFIPTLKIVMAKNLNNLSQWAQNLLSQLQSGTTTA